MSGVMARSFFYAPPEITAWQKTGDIPGMYGTNMVLLPEERLGVVVFGTAGSLENTFASSHAMKIANRILIRAMVERGKIPKISDPLSEVSLLQLEFEGRGRGILARCLGRRPKLSSLDHAGRWTYCKSGHSTILSGSWQS